MSEKFERCEIWAMYLRVPLCYEQSGLYIIFKWLTKQFDKFNSN